MSSSLVAVRLAFRRPLHLRENERIGRITIVADEVAAPYQRPPLSKDFLTKGGDPTALPLRGGDFFAANDIGLLTGHNALSIDREAKVVLLTGERQVPYDALVLATGSTHRSLSVPGVELEGVFSLRTLEDAELRFNDAIASIEGDNGQVAAVTSSSGDRYLADLVVVGVGVMPNTRLAAEADLEIDNGIVVDQHLRTRDPVIYAIGDCVSFPSPHAGEHVRVESVQNATDQARHVARVIAGDSVPYAAVPWFWSTQGPYRLQIAGLIGAGVTTVVRGDPGVNKFSVFAFDGGQLVAVESLNSPADHIASRRLLESGRGLTPEQAADLSFNLKAHARGN